MIKELLARVFAPKYLPAFYCRPTLHLVFLDGEEVDFTPDYFSVSCADVPACYWDLWLRDGILANRYPITAIKKITADWEIIAIKRTHSDLAMMSYSWLTYDEIQEKIAKNFFKKA